MERREDVIPLSNGDSVDCTWLIPSDALALLVFSHGAGADHRHASMEAIAEHLGGQGLATLRYNFPFMQAGKRRVDSVDVATATIAEAYAYAQRTLPLPTFLAGHSFGGRMNSHAQLAHHIDCLGIVFFSFPLHPPKKPATQRAEHLPQLDLPMLFLSGTRDDLADAALLTDVVGSLDRAHLHWLETANHSYVTLKRTRTNPLTVFEEIAIETRAFVAGLV